MAAATIGAQVVVRPEPGGPPAPPPKLDATSGSSPKAVNASVPPPPTSPTAPSAPAPSSSPPRQTTVAPPPGQAPRQALEILEPLDSVRRDFRAFLDDQRPQLRAAPESPGTIVTAGTSGGTGIRENAVYAAVYRGAQQELLPLYRSGIQLLESYDAPSAAANPERFRMHVKGLLQHLKGQQYEPPTVELPDGRSMTTGRAAFLQFVQGFGELGDAEQVVNLLWDGVDPVAGMHDPDSPAVDAAIDRLGAQASALHGRLQDRLQALESRYEGTAESPGRGLDQAMDLLADFPDIAGRIYERANLKGLRGVPPVADATAAATPASRQFAASAAAWHETKERLEYVRMGSLMAAGFVLMIASRGMAGGTVAMAGLGFALGTVPSIAQVVASMRALQESADAAAVGAASLETVQYKQNDLVGAYGALVVNVATVGLGSRVGAGALMSSGLRASVPNLVTHYARSAAIGAGSSALATIVNPNVWQSDATLGAIAKATVIGGVSGLAFGAAGQLVSRLNPQTRQVSLAFYRDANGGAVQVGSRVGVLIDAPGERVPLAGVVRAIDLASGELTVRVDGADLRVRVTTAELMGMNPAINRAVLTDAQITPRMVAGPDAPLASPSVAHPFDTSKAQPLRAGPLRTGRTVMVVDELGSAVPYTVKKASQRRAVLTRLSEDGTGAVVSLEITIADYHRVIDAQGTLTIMPSRLLARAAKLQRSRYTETPLPQDAGGYALHRHKDPAHALPNEPWLAVWPPRMLGPNPLDHNRAFDTGPRLPRLSRYDLDGHGAKPSPREVVVFGAHGSPFGFEGLETRDAACLLTDLVLAENKSAVGGTKLRYIHLSSCSQGTRRVLQLFGKTNAQAMQKYVNERLIEKGLNPSGPDGITVLASDRPGVLLGDEWVDVQGAPVPTTFVPAARQDPVRYMTTGQRLEAVAPAATVAAVTAVTAAGVTVLGLITLEPDEAMDWNEQAPSVSAPSAQPLPTPQPLAAQPLEDGGQPDGGASGH